MKFHVRLGSATLAGVFALSAIGAAQAENEDPSEIPTAETSPTASPTPTIVNPPAGTLHETTNSERETSVPEDDSEVSSSSTGDTSVKCEFEYAVAPSTVITIPDHLQFDSVTVEVDDEPVDSVSVDGHTATLNIDASDSLIEVSMWQDNQLRGDCSDNADAKENSDSPTPTPTPTGEATNPDGSDTETPDDPTTPAPEPEPPVDPSPSASAPVAPPEDNDSAVPPQQPPPPRPSTSQAPVEPAPPTQNNNRGNDDPAPAAPVPQPPSQESTSPVEREIRQHSDNPRHLLSRIWNTDSHNGSGLIMPRPRDHSAEATELETLPPVSEDELDAIKARVSTPDKGNGLASDDLLRADVNERLTHSDTWWLVSSIVGLGVLGAGVWWAVARRKPRH